ncbi:STE3-domain-containing protein [Peniophora sp. CONT]|nr:STE3-domain-containing protein [Peniophora sp. CONT]
MVFVSSFVRHNWNLGVTFLCFWLLLENVTNTVDAIVWSDNYDIKLYVYCDIDSRLRLLVYFVKPMATLIITRRLYLIVSLQSVEPPSKAAVRTLCVTLMLDVCCPILTRYSDYINQSTRFEVIEGFGCTDSSDVSILEVLIEESWAVIPPLVSIIFYYRA